MVSREEQYQQRKKQLEELALDSFIDKGYDGTTTKDLANQAKISSGLLFHYFETKEVLFDHLWNISYSYFTEFMSNPPQTNSPKELIEHVVTKLFHEYKTNEKSAKYILYVIKFRNHYTNNPKVVKDQEDLQKLVSSVAPAILLGQQLGEFKKDNPTALAGAFFGFLYGVTVNHVTLQFPLPEPSWVMNILTKE